MEITLASYKGDDNGFDMFEPFDSLIRLVTKKKHSHNELIINGVSYSSLALKGAVQRVRYYDNSKWDFAQSLLVLLIRICILPVNCTNTATRI